MNIAAWAERYVERFGFALTYMPRGTKAPIHERWNCDERLLRTPEQVRAHFRRRGHERDNIGVVLETSGLVSLDADYLDGARLILAAEGIQLDRLIADGPTIIGRNPRIDCLAPPSVELSRKKITWPPRAAGEKPITVLEFRAGRLHDVLPPSMHPDTGQPYAWNPPPRSGFPELSDELLRVWLDFERFAHRARNLCPWAAPEPERVPILRRTQPFAGRSVIAAFNDAHSTVAILESYGYQRAGKRRWKSPNGHGVAGVVLLDSGKVFCHHTSDDLGDERAHDAFDLFRLFEHGGDTRAAVRAAARILGLDQQGRAA